MYLRKKKGYKVCISSLLVDHIYIVFDRQSVKSIFFFRQKPKPLWKKDYDFQVVIHIKPSKDIYRAIHREHVL